MAHSPIFYPPIDSDQRIRECFTPPNFSHVWYTTVAKLYTTVALYGLSGFNEITECIINPLCDISVGFVFRPEV